MTRRRSVFAIGLTLLVASLFCLGCASAKNEIRARAETASKQSQVAMSALTSASTALDTAAGAATGADASVSAAKASATQSPPDIPQTVKALDDAAAQIALGARATGQAKADIKTAQKAVAITAEAVAPVPDLVNKVQDKGSGWFSGLWKYSAMALLGLIVAALIAGKMYGFDQVIRPVLAILTFPFRWLAQWMDDRWSGPAKLAKEALTGKSSPRELVAALRAAFPGLNREMKRARNNAK